jgi:predicted MFS family arabinose efflux permease
LLALLLATPWLLRGQRADALSGLALCMIASGLAGVVASYYGDAVELSRHCYGAGQQVVLGMFLALVARLDRVGHPARLSPRSVSESR